MKLTLTAALLATTALAIPLGPDDTTYYNGTEDSLIVSRSAAAAGGEDADMQITTYTSQNCKGPAGLVNQKMLYNTQVSQQMRSYHLSRDLGPDDIMTVYADAGWTPGAVGTQSIKPSLNGDMAACAYRVYGLSGDLTKQGCRTLKNNVGCIKIATI